MSRRGTTGRRLGNAGNRLVCLDLVFVAVNLIFLDDDLDHERLVMKVRAFSRGRRICRQEDVSQGALGDGLRRFVRMLDAKLHPQLTIYERAFHYVERQLEQGSVTRFRRSDFGIRDLNLVVSRR